jgi:hypothetical protein
MIRHATSTETGCLQALIWISSERFHLGELGVNAETDLEGLNWIKLAEDVIQLRNSVKKVENVRVPFELCYSVLLLDNDSEISNYKTAVTRQQPVNSNRGRVFSVRSVPNCYKEDQSVIDLVREPLEISCCELLL